jgi:hypothetical protein
MVKCGIVFEVRTEFNMYIIILHGLAHILFRSHIWLQLLQGRPTVRLPQCSYCTICLDILSSGMRSKRILQLSP